VSPSPASSLALEEEEQEPEADDKKWRERLKHEIASGFVFLGCIGLLCCITLPISCYHRWRWGQFAGADDSFKEYGQYRFFNWFTRNQWAPIVVVVSLTLFIVVAGAIVYALVVGGAPSQAMFKVFVWASASSADTESTVGGRFLGVIVTVLGLIILALLLSMVTEAFSMKMQQVKMGMDNVCEGGHVVILGFSQATKTLLEEMAMAYETDGGVIFVILAVEPKLDVELELARLGIGSFVKNSTVIVRSGNPSSYHSLKQVAADKASKVLSLMDHSVTPEEALAKQIRTLLALKSQSWPLEGTIVVQVTSDGDKELVQSIYPDTDTTKVEVVVIGDIVAKLMVQSAWEHGLAGVFGKMLGFEGDEFYFKAFPDLVGKSFLETYFRIPNAVALGVLTGKGTCLLNPGWDYKIKKDDEVIVLAEDDDTFDVEDDPYFNFKQPPENTMSPGRFTQERLSHKTTPITEPCTALIIGWNHNLGKLLATIASTFPAGSKLTIFSDVSQEVRDKVFKRLEESGRAELSSLKIDHVVVDKEDMTSRAKLYKLQHWKARAIFILADADALQGDDTNVAVLAQLQFIGRSQNSLYVFDPVVEMCEHSTADHLKVADLDNLIHSSSLISQALSAVTYDPKVNKIYTEFFSKSENGFAIAKLTEFMPGNRAPRCVSFAEAALMTSNTSQAVLVGWTISNPDTGAKIEWVLNPKDKTQQRPWCDDDRVCVIVKNDKRPITPRGGLE
jgi:Trk K+ transport system NAD-binding subunit